VSWIEVRAHFDSAPEDWSPLIDLFLGHGIENTLQVDLPPSLVACVVEVPGALQEIEALKSELEIAGARLVEVGPYEEQDWEEAWKKFFKPRRIGSKFVVRPTWEEFKALPGDHVIVLDPGQAFGTGDHPTTRMCLALLEGADVSGARVLDVGCGSGVLSIGAKLLGAAEVLAVDIDPLAVEVSKQNFALNEVSVDAQVSEGLPDRVTGDGRQVTGAGASWDVILSNIISAALIRLAPDVAMAMPTGGRWIVSGILNANWPDVREAATAQGFKLKSHMEEDEWVAATFLR
jgi:ribosomal protein L11 methyltransferase